MFYIFLCLIKYKTLQNSLFQYSSTFIRQSFKNPTIVHNLADNNPEKKQYKPTSL